MIDGYLYIVIYLLIVTLMTFFTLSNYNYQGTLRSSSVNRLWGVSFLLLIGVTLFIGTRPQSNAFGDMGTYHATYNIVSEEIFYFDWDVDNLIWDNLFAWMACSNVPFSNWLIIVSILYFGLLFWACYKLFDKDLLLAFVVYLGAFSTFSYGTNGMKAGVAASVFLVAMAYRDKLFISIPFALLSYGFHHSMAMVIAAYFIVIFFKKTQYYFWFWVMCVILSALHVTYFQTLFAGFTDEQGAEYLLARGGGDYIIGFRPDFILYSAVPVIVGFFMLTKYSYKPKMYVFLLNLYIMTNSLWMLCMYASYSNRIAYLSWLMYPFVLLYPFVGHDANNVQGKYLRWVVYSHLGFTLLMYTING